MTVLYDPYIRPIDSFTGRWRFLSNFYYLPVIEGIEHDRIRFSTVEHAYQAAKSNDDNIRLWFQIGACKRCHYHIRFHQQFAPIQPHYCPKSFDDGEAVDWFSNFSFEKLGPGDAKRMGRKVQLRPDWEKVKLDVMLELLRLKFKIPSMKEDLVSTGQAQLIEGNDWGDRFWGVCAGEGENHLGRLLMQVRHEVNGGRN